MEKKTSLQDLAQELYSFLASRFPVCCRSDEFVFFPQAVEKNTDWSRWDDLSPDSVEDAAARIRTLRQKLGRGSGFDQAPPDQGGSLVSVLVWLAQALEEQLTLVRAHATQPTFALTVGTVGLIQALQSGEDHAWDERLQALPRFLERASQSLSRVPGLYRDLGVEMAVELASWLGSFGSDDLTRKAVHAVSNYGVRLSQLSVEEDFRLEPDLFERVVHYHTGSALGVRETLEELEEEESCLRALLIREARKRGHGRDWESAYLAVGGVPVPADGRKGLLARAIDRLRDHCRRHGFLGATHPGHGMLSIEILPTSLTSIRAADSYTARPGHPFPGGVFYIFEGGSLGRSAGPIHPVYRMTAAHEVYPGHHLLDFHRWNHPDSTLRPVEYPLFYEGWACFGEDLMLYTGAFDRPYDRLVLLRRRFLHAVRGKVDLKLHAGLIGAGEASRLLTSAGFSAQRARDTVRKYALRPAYQMCYTIGRRRFQRLFDTYGIEDPAGFVSTVFSSGEILLEDLEKAFQGHGAGAKERGEGGESEV